MHKVLHAALAVFFIGLALVVAPSGARAGTALRMTVPDLVNNAELVFEGRVLDARVVPAANGRVATEYFVSVHETYWGLPYGTQTFRMPGGVLPDGSGMVVPGMPEVNVGEDAIFFLTESSPAGVRMPVGLAQGKLTVVVDPLGDKQLQRSQEGLMLANPATGAVVPAEERALVDYDQMVSAIRAAAQAKAVLEQEQR